MHDLYALKDMLCKELEEYGAKGELTADSLDVIDKLAHAAKNLDKIIKSCDENEDYSPRSNSKRRDNNRYSRSSDSTTDRLRDMADEAPDERTKAELQRILAKLV